MANRHALAASAPSNTTPPVDFSGTWLNELGSKMELEQDGPSVTGSYWSSVSEEENPADGVVVGFADANLISFVVRWLGSEALTAWVGLFEDDNHGPRLSTLWHMVQVVSSPVDDWEAIHAGADVFTRDD